MAACRERARRQLVGHGEPGRHCWRKAGAVPQARGARRQCGVSPGQCRYRGRANYSTRREGRAGHRRILPVRISRPLPGAAIAHLAGAGHRQGRAPFSTSTSRPAPGGLTRASSVSSARRPREPELARARLGLGASRLLDYLETNPEVDAKRAVIEGVPIWRPAGDHGVRALRHRLHWLFGRRRAGTPQLGEEAGERRRRRIPLDGRQLIKYAADPWVERLSGRARTHCAGSATTVVVGPVRRASDGWVDPKGMFMAAAAAGPVYRLLGKKDLGTTVFPPVETALTAGGLAYRQHSGGHTSGPNWPTFLQFAARHFGAP